MYPQSAHTHSPSQYFPDIAVSPLERPLGLREEGPESVAARILLKERAGRTGMKATEERVMSTRQTKVKIVKGA